MTPTEAARGDDIAAFQARVCDLQAHIEALETTTTQLQALVGATFQTTTPRPTTPVSTATPADEPPVTLSTLVDTVVVDTDGPAHFQVQSITSG